MKEYLICELSGVSEEEYVEQNKHLEKFYVIFKVETYDEEGEWDYDTFEGFVFGKNKKDVKNQLEQLKCFYDITILSSTDFSIKYLEEILKRTSYDEIKDGEILRQEDMLKAVQDVHKMAKYIIKKMKGWYL